MNKLVTILLTLAALSVALPAGLAAHCTKIHTSEALIERDGYYVAIDRCLGDCVLSAWVYEESNGIVGLQRLDDQVDDTCHGRIEPDTIVM